MDNWDGTEISEVTYITRNLQQDGSWTDPETIRHLRI